MPPKPSHDLVNETRLQAVVARIDAQLKSLGEGNSKLNARVDKIGDDIGRLTTAIKKEAEDRKKDMSGFRSNMQLLTLLPLLGTSTTKSVTGDNVAGTDLVKGDKIVVDKGNSLTTLLPLMLMGGMGGSPDGSTSSSGSGYGSGGMNDPMSMMVLVLALSGGLGGK